MFRDKFFYALQFCILKFLAFSSLTTECTRKTTYTYHIQLLLPNNAKCKLQNKLPEQGNKMTNNYHSKERKMQPSETLKLK